MDVATDKQLSKEETRELIQQAQNGSEEAMEQLIISQTKLIQYVVNKFQHTKHDPEDLFQLACIGFMKCVNNFDLNTNFTFSTYAVPLINNEIYNFIRVEGTMRVPRSIQKVERLIIRNNVYNKTPEEISEIIGEPNIDLIKKTLLYIRKGKVASLNKVVFEDEGNDITLGDRLSGDINGAWFDSLALKDAIERLNEREKQIVEMRYVKDMTQREVATVFGVSQVQISRLESSLIQKLREAMEAPLTVPKVEKPKNENKGSKTVPMELKGDREQAIHLLKTSTLSYNDIAAMTGVPHGTMCKLGKKHRPQFIIDQIKKRSRHKKGDLNVYEG